MSLRKEYKLAAKSVSKQHQVASELQALLASVEKAERTITELKTELEQVNRTYQVRSSTQEDIDFLTALLKCAQKKLGWEKQVASIRKRAPVLMTDLTAILNDPKNPPSEASCASLLEAMQQVKAAVERLEQAGASG
jgi:septation ring formation regulator EzrA